MDSAAGTGGTTPVAAVRVERVQVRLLLPGVVVLRRHRRARRRLARRGAARGPSRPGRGHRGRASLCTAAAGLATLTRAPRLGWLVTLGALVAALAAAGSRLALAHVNRVHSAPHDRRDSRRARRHGDFGPRPVVACPTACSGAGRARSAPALWYAVASSVAVVLTTTGHVLAPWPAARRMAGGGVLDASDGAVPLPRSAGYGTPADAVDRRRGGAGRRGRPCRGDAQPARGLAGPDRGSRGRRRGARGARPACARPARVSLRTPTACSCTCSRSSVSAVVVSAIYLIVVRGLGKTPTGTTDREVLGLSIVAAAIAAVGYIPARDRFARMATGFVYGAREAPDEVVRTFGSRLTRAIPMDELLLQLAESLAKDARPPVGGDLHRHRRGARARRVGPRSRCPLSCRLRPRAPGDHPCRGVGQRLGLGLDAGAVERACGRTDPGGPDLPRRRAARDDRGGPGAKAPSASPRRTTASSPSLHARSASHFTTPSSTPPCRPRSTSCGARPTSCAPRGRASSRAATPSAAGSSGTCTMAPSSTWSPWRSTCASSRTSSSEDPEGGRRDARGARDGGAGHHPGAARARPRDLSAAARRQRPRGALRPVVNRSPLDIELSTEGIGRYDGDIEAAVYFCCLEALQNAGKHAARAHVTVRIWEESGGLLFAVTDDGPGFDVRKAQRGHGFINMMDRLGAIGGSVRWESEPGHGTADPGLGAAQLSSQAGSAHEAVGRRVLPRAGAGVDGPNCSLCMYARAPLVLASSGRDR